MQTALLTLWTFLCLAPSQEPVALKRDLKVGDESRYAVKISASAEIGDIDIQFKARHKVQKVDSEGSADIEYSTEELTTKINGQDAPGGAARAMDPLVFRFDRHGRPLTSLGGANGTSAFMQVLGFLGDRPLSPGVKSDYEFVEKENDKRRATGSLLLDSVKDGEAKLISNWQIFNERSPVPMKIDMTSFIEVKTGIVLRASGSIVPSSPAGTGARALQFSMELLRKS